MKQPEVFQMFRQGTAHPHCPVCGHTRLQHLQAAQVDQEIWRTYKCSRCKELFRATVHAEPVDITV